MTRTLVITPETPVRDVVEIYPETLEIFERHGVSVHDDCPGDVIDFPLEDCNWMCGIHDVEALVEELNGAVSAGA